MNITIDTQTLAEMFADMADIFCESVEKDGLSMLLSYCLETSGLPDGLILMRGESPATDVVVHCSDDPSAIIDAPQSALRAIQSLQPECMVYNSDSVIHFDYAFPLRVRGSALGAIALFGDDLHTLDEYAVSVLQSVADIAATTIDQTHRIQQAQSLVTQLQRALDSRVIIEQAKGVLAAVNKTDMSSAFHELRTTARRQQRPVRAVAADIVSNIHSFVA